MKIYSLLIALIVFKEFREFFNIRIFNQGSCLSFRFDLLFIELFDFFIDLLIAFHLGISRVRIIFQWIRDQFFLENLCNFIVSPESITHVFCVKYLGQSYKTIPHAPRREMVQFVLFLISINEDSRWLKHLLNWYSATAKQKCQLQQRLSCPFI